MIVSESILSILLVGTTLFDVDDAVGGILDYLRIRVLCWLEGLV